MRLVLFGPPGAGKGTQATRIKEAFGVVHIATGDIFRANVEGETEVGLEAQEYMDRGELVPDDVVIRMVEARLVQPDAQQGFLLDGFPRTVAQAEALQDFLQRNDRPLDAVVRLVVGEDELFERLAGRQREEGRTDDEAEVVEQRLEEYREKTAPLEEYYRDHGLLVDVDGTGTVDEVSERLLDALRERTGEGSQA